MQFKGKLMIETWQNSKSLISGPILARLWHIWGPEILFVSLPLLVVTYCPKLLSYVIS